MNRNIRTLKIVSQRRTRIFSRWLKIRFEKPYTLFLAALFPFLQAFLASILSIFTNGKNDVSTNILLFSTAALYYFSFAMNAKRATKGTWLGLLFLILFGAIGIVTGKIFTLLVLSK